ncbi:hypothetical protein P3T75_05795 [Enterococcus montenegrensis]|uniref:hypothetical protein n=1 Tax=Enterococcus montenegrensis TaxID=3031993 RepID=UPI00249E8769|nr:hypothetical protein [Enterococcus montenegrensis]WHA10317.1 hypothetical protein P3T75_05795 [Enterococcus montenegrensis]
MTTASDTVVNMVEQYNVSNDYELYLKLWLEQYEHSLDVLKEIYNELPESYCDTDMDAIFDYALKITIDEWQDGNDSAFTAEVNRNLRCTGHGILFAEQQNKTEYYPLELAIHEVVSDLTQDVQVSMNCLNAFNQQEHEMCLLLIFDAMPYLSAKDKQESMKFLARTFLVADIELEISEAQKAFKAFFKAWEGEVA